MRGKRRAELAARVAPIAVAAVQLARESGADAFRLAEKAALEECRDLCGRALIKLAAAAAVAAIEAIPPPD